MIKLVTLRRRWLAFYSHLKMGRGPVRAIQTAVLVLSLALGLASCGTMDRSTPVVDDGSIDPFDLSITIGRVGVMTDQVQDALTVIGQGQFAALDGMDVAGDEAGDFFQQLHTILFRYNMAHMEACAQGWLAVEACQGSYVPKWLKRSKMDRPSFAEIQQWSDDLQARVSDLQGVVCRPAVQKTGDDYFCAIE